MNGNEWTVMEHQWNVNENQWSVNGTQWAFKAGIQKHTGISPCFSTELSMEMKEMSWNNNEMSMQINEMFMEIKELSKLEFKKIQEFPLVLIRNFNGHEWNVMEHKWNINENQWSVNGAQWTLKAGIGKNKKHNLPLF